MKSLFLWGLPLGLWLLFMPLRGYSFQWAEIAHSIVFAILTWWALKKYVPKAGFWRTLTPLFAPWLLELIVRLFLPDTLFSLPVTVFPLWAVATVVLFYHTQKKWLLLLCTAVWLFGVTEGEKQWYEWINYSDKPVTIVNLADSEVSDSVSTFKLTEIGPDYLMLDVWYSKCGACLREMPKVDELRNKYKGSGNVEVASLFVTLIEGETIDDGYRIMKKLGCNVPVYCIDKDSPILKECDIEAYPRVLILDKKRNVIFNGSLEFAKRKLNVMSHRGQDTS